MNLTAGDRRLLQDRRTVVTVQDVDGDDVYWLADDGTPGDTSLRIFTAVTTPGDDDPKAA